MATSLQLKPPGVLSLDGNVAKNWKVWLRSWDLFAQATELSNKDEPVQCATFLHVAGIQAQEVYATFTMPDADKKKIQKVKDKFAEYCEPKKNTTVCRYLFNSRQQKGDEKFSDYLTALKTLINDCEYGNHEDELLRDRIVCGIYESKVRERLLRMDKLTLKQAIDVCQVAEMSTAQLKSLKFDTQDVNSVVRKWKKDGGKGRTGKKSFNFKKKDCERCSYAHEPGKCPSMGQTCHKCGKQNHFADKCRSAGQDNGQAGNKNMAPSRRP